MSLNKELLRTEDNNEPELPESDASVQDDGDQKEGWAPRATEQLKPAEGSAKIVRQNPKTIYMNQAKRHANKSNSSNNAKRINKGNNSSNNKINKQISVQRKVT